MDNTNKSIHSLQIPSTMFNKQMLRVCVGVFISIFMQFFTLFNNFTDDQNDPAHFIHNNTEKYQTEIVRWLTAS